MPSETIVSSASARRFVVEALRGAVGTPVPQIASGGRQLNEQEARSALAIVTHNKIAGLIQRGLSATSVVASSSFTQFLEAQVKVTIAKNLENLIETYNVSALLERAGIDFVIMKGAVRSYQVYRGLDTRPSGDIDVLVSRDQYVRAGEVLCDNGYIRGVAQDDKWWHRHLGESPYLPTRSRCIVDVHHKVQQPGAPRPLMGEEFLGAKSLTYAAHRQFWTLRWDHALLLTYISISKAMCHRECWLGYAAEIAKVRNDMSEADRARFQAMARHQGLARMVAQIDQIANVILYEEEPRAVTSSRERRVAELGRAAFDPEGGLPRQLHRSRLLWQWTSGVGCVRAMRFMGMTSERVMSDFCRPRSASRP